MAQVSHVSEDSHLSGLSKVLEIIFQELKAKIRPPFGQGEDFTAHSYYTNLYDLYCPHWNGTCLHHYDSSRWDTPWTLQVHSPADKLFQLTMAFLHLRPWRVVVLFKDAWGFSSRSRSLFLSTDEDFCRIVVGTLYSEGLSPTCCRLVINENLLIQSPISNKILSLCVCAFLRMWFSICIIFQGTFPRLLEFT